MRKAEISYDTWKEISFVINRQIGRNEYHIRKMASGPIRDGLIADNERLDAADKKLTNEFFGWASEAAA